MTFWDLVVATARSHPDRSVVADDHGRELTSAGLRDAAESVAAGLEVAPGEVVSWQLPTSLEAAVLMVALARLGAVQNPIIPILRDAEVGLITTQAKTSLLVVPETWRGYSHGDLARRSGVARTLALDLEGVPGPDLRLPTGSGPLPAPPTDDGECRWIYFSSGTTAAPKGVRHTDRSVTSSSGGMVELLGYGPDDVYPIAWPFTHIGGISMLTSALRGGSKLVLFDTFDPVGTPERMATHAPTILGSATPFFRAYMDAQRRHGDEPLFPALRTCVGGGAPTPPEINRELIEVFGIRGAVGSWGLTEFPIASSATPDDPPEVLAASVGRPGPGVSVRVVDGELRLKGPQCFLGYLDETLDAAAFDEDGWFRTGDLGRVDDDGRVYITGRLKDVIIRNAENISALEVEDALLRHPDVADVAVIGLPDARTGERVCALVVAAPGADVTVSSLGAHCVAQGLARQKCPEQVEVVEALPRNPMGKVLKQQLRDELLRGAVRP